MNHTAAIRQYCLEHPDDLFDADYVHGRYFPLINNKVFLTLLGRLEAEGFLKKLDRGVYILSWLSCSDPHSAVVAYYAGGTNGMEIAENCFYTRLLSTGKRKRICSVQLIGANLVYDEPTKLLISLLYLIEKYHRLNLPPEEYFKRRKELVSRLTTLYSDAMFREVVRTIPFRYGTVVVLADLLYQANIPNTCKTIYSTVSF